MFDLATHPIASMVFFGGAIIFAIATVVFYPYRLNKKGGWHHSAWIVSLVTVVSYVVMFATSLDGWFDVSFDFFTRWIGYAISCSLLMKTMVDYLKIDKKYAWQSIALTPIIMFTGVFASGGMGILATAGFFAIGGILFIHVIRMLRTSKVVYKNQLLNYVYFGWIGFPIVFLFSPETFNLLPRFGIISGLYLIFDIATKLFFYRTIRTIDKKS